MILPAFNSSYERQLWIVSSLKLAGSSVAELARKHGCARSNLDTAFHRPHDRSEKILAEELGVSQKDLFPERYNERGQRLFRIRRQIKESAAA